MLPHLCGTLIGPHGRTLALVGSDCANVMWAPTGKFKDVCRRKLLDIYASTFMWHPHWAPRKNIGFSRFRLCQCHVGSNREVKGCVPNIAPWALGTILDSKLLSLKWQEAVSDILSTSTQSDPSTTRE
ncbi:hypothetical protein O181_055701 [Austropuccinia psidii MF-1]|uniref:Uncharacterized protein n=1 Tax=Austropuccinia psidii MF-1 TaxID=1389203 RepID=A0A9Q3E4Z0_9BASI|nr:hypothetical protein [Austropuccinia psidii MF-1]